MNPVSPRPFTARRAMCTTLLRTLLGTLFGTLFGTLLSTLTLAPPVHAQPADAERSMPVSGAQGVSLRIPADLVVRQGEREQLVLRAEPKVLERIEVTIRDAVVVIDSKPPGFQTQRPILLQLTLRNVRTLHADASGTLRSGPLRADRLDLTLEGSGDIFLGKVDARSLMVSVTGSGTCTIDGGHVAALEVELDGSGDFEAPELDSLRARVEAKGSGSARLRVREQLDAIIEGSGDIEFTGPARVTSRVDGAGEVRRR